MGCQVQAWKVLARPEAGSASVNCYLRPGRPKLKVVWAQSGAEGLGLGVCGGPGGWVQVVVRVWVVQGSAPGSGSQVPGIMVNVFVKHVARICVKTP